MKMTICVLSSIIFFIAQIPPTAIEIATEEEVRAYVYTNLCFVFICTKQFVFVALFILCVFLILCQYMFCS